MGTVRVITYVLHKASYTIKTIDLKNTSRETCACQMYLIVIHIRAAEINAREQGVKKNLKRIAMGGNE